MPENQRYPGETEEDFENRIFLKNFGPSDAELLGATQSTTVTPSGEIVATGPARVEQSPLELSRAEYTRRENEWEQMAAGEDYSQAEFVKEDQAEPSVYGSAAVSGSDKVSLTESSSTPVYAHQIKLPAAESPRIDPEQAQQLAQSRRITGAALGAVEEKGNIEAGLAEEKHKKLMGWVDEDGLPHEGAIPKLEREQKENEVARVAANVQADEDMASIRTRIESHRSMKVDDNFYNRSTTGGKIGMIISAAMGGWLAPLQGGRNPALEMIEKAIQMDIRNQEYAIAKVDKEIDRDRDMYKDSLALVKDRIQAKDLYAIRLYKSVGRQLKAAELKATGAAAKQNAIITAAGLLQKQNQYEGSLHQQRFTNDMALRQQVAVEKKYKQEKRDRYRAYSLRKKEFDRKKEREDAVVVGDKYFIAPIKTTHKGFKNLTGPNWELGTWRQGIKTVRRNQIAKQLGDNDRSISYISDFYQKLKDNYRRDITYVLSEKDQAMFSQWRLNVQMLARSMDTGALAEGDIKRTEKMLPGLLVNFHPKDVFKGKPNAAVENLIRMKIKEQKRMMYHAFEGGGNKDIRDNMWHYYNPTAKDLPQEPVSEHAEIEKLRKSQISLEDQESEGSISGYNAATTKTNIATQALEVSEGIAESTLKDHSKKVDDPGHIEANTGKSMTDSVEWALNQTVRAAQGPGWAVPDLPTGAVSEQHESPTDKTKTVATVKRERRARVLGLYKKFATVNAQYSAINEVRNEGGGESFPMLPRRFKEQENRWSPKELKEIEKTWAKANYKFLVKYRKADARKIYKKDIEGGMPLEKARTKWWANEERAKNEEALVK